MKWIYCKRVINSSSNGERTEYRMKTSSVKEELFPCHRWGTTQGGWITSLRSHSRVGPRFKFGSGRGRFVLGKPGLHDPTSTWPSGLALISRLQCFVLFWFTFKITINTVPTLPGGDGGRWLRVSCQNTAARLPHAGRLGRESTHGHSPAGETPRSREGMQTGFRWDSSADVLAGGQQVKWEKGQGDWTSRFSNS